MLRGPFLRIGHQPNSIGAWSISEIQQERRGESNVKRMGMSKNGTSPGFSQQGRDGPRASESAFRVESSPSVGNYNGLIEAIIIKREKQSGRKVGHMHHYFIQFHSNPVHRDPNPASPPILTPHLLRHRHFPLPVLHPPQLQLISPLHARQLKHQDQPTRQHRRQVPQQNDRCIQQSSEE